MISIDKARELQAAGLKHKITDGDHYYNHERDSIYLYCYSCYCEMGDDDINDINNIWLPSLSQLLAEIEARGWDVHRFSIIKSKSCVLMHRTNGEHIEADWSPYFDVDTPEDAAASALLWILKEAGE